MTGILMDADLEKRWNAVISLKNNLNPSPEKSDWDSRCLNSIRKERLAAEGRYGIRIKQTDICCARCGRPWGFGGHVCQDARLARLKQARKGVKQTPKMDVPLIQAEFTSKMPLRGRRTSYSVV